MLNRLRDLVCGFTVAALLAGCTTYHPAPLPDTADMAPAAPPGMMDMESVERLALERSPDLIVRRHQANVAQAQAHAGGVLPDPQLSASIDRPTNNLSGLTDAYGLGLAEDLQALLTQGTRANAAKAKAKQAELEVLWAEWQTVQSAATLYTSKLFADRKVEVLSATTDILTAQSNRSLPALDAHDTTIDVAGADLSAALDIASQKDAAARAAVSADADLKALLNLAPTSELNLSDLARPAPISREALTAALAKVASARPDLLALKAGYHAQEEAVRTAILEQFPAINIGFNRARDTSDITTNGLAVSVNIPIFGGAQAKIRTERATRAELMAEYQARLDRTEADAWRIWRALTLVRAQVDRLSAKLPALRRMAKTGQQAYDAGNLLPATYALLQTTLSARESELLDLQSTLWADTIALKTLLAMPLVQPKAEEDRK